MIFCWSSKLTASAKSRELNSHIRWVNIRENRSLRNGIKRYFTTGRSRKKRQMQQGTAPPRYATFRHCTDNQNHETLVKQVCRAEFITHIMRLLISLWDVGTVFFTIYPQVFRHEKSSIYYKYIEPLSYCFSISFKILIITVYGFMKWYICKCLFCKVYLLDLSYNRNAKPMTGSNELRFNLTQIRG